jgi:hypothetical protein
MITNLLLSPAKSYYSEEVKVAEHFSRAANGGIELLKLQVIMLHNFTQLA